MWYFVILCDIMLYYVILHYIMLYYVLLYYFMLCYIMLYCVYVCYVVFILYNVMLRYITLLYVILYCFVLYYIILYVCMYMMSIGPHCSNESSTPKGYVLLEICERYLFRGFRETTADWANLLQIRSPKLGGCKTPQF